MLLQRSSYCLISGVRGGFFYWGGETVTPRSLLAPLWASRMLPNTGFRLHWSARLSWRLINAALGQPDSSAYSQESVVGLTRPF